MEAHLGHGELLQRLQLEAAGLGQQSIVAANAREQDEAGGARLEQAIRSPGAGGNDGRVLCRAAVSD